MRKYLLMLLGAVVFTFAQAQNPKKLMSQAKKDMGKYFEDPVANADLLASSTQMVEQAFADAEYSSKAKNHNKKGEFFAMLADNQIKAVLLNPEAAFVHDKAALMALSSYQKAHEMAQKKGDKKDAIKGVVALEGILNNFASQQYTLQNYAGAFENFQGTLDANKMLTAAGEASRIVDEAALKEQKFFTAISGYFGEQFEGAYPLYKELYEMGTDEASIYEGLYKMASKNGEEDAIKYLEEGRAKFPDDTALLFGEINYYLEKGELNTLITKLEVALEKEPNNTSVINTLGSVYDNLHVSAKEEGDMAKSDEYFDKAKGYYERVLAQDKSNFDGTYSLGALYYNRAAGMTADLNELSNDFTPAGTKKYDEIKAKMDNLFGDALPYFLRAETIKSDDLNTIVALKEIYARQSDFAKVDEYKAKLEAIQGQ